MKGNIMTEKKIRFSAGHGAGKSYNRGGKLFNEGDENYIFANMISDYLNKHYKVDSKEIRKVKGNKDHSLSSRSAWGSGAELFYSSHSNAGGGNGVEVILSYQSLAYYDFADELCKTIASTLGIPNRGVKFKHRKTENFETKSQAKSTTKNWYGELNNNKAKCAVLVEHFFHDSTKDSRSYINNKKKLAENIGELIAKHFELESRIASIPETETGYNVKLKTGRLIVRQEPSANSAIKGYLDNRYKIVEERGAWGRLSTGGWIALKFTDKL